MQRLHVSPDAPDPAAIARAAERLRAGALVAFPTETVYGLGAHALDPAAVARIYAAKGRPAHNPVIVHVADEAGARRVVRAWPPMAARLAARWWPGPLTLVLPRAATVPDIVTAGLDRVGVRIPAHPVALALLRAAGVPVAAPSANRSNAVSPTTAAHVIASLGDADVLVLDGGPCDVGIESTVVDVSGDVPVLLRPGGVARDALETELGMTVALHPSLAALASATGEFGAREADHANDAHRDSARAGAASGMDRADDVVTPLAAPGMLRKHYAPRATVRLVGAGDVSAMTVALDEARALHGDAVGVLAITAIPLDPGAVTVHAMPDDPAAYARVLYATLHELDAREVAMVLIEQVPASAAWDGIRDRLVRAAA